ncbi:MAG: serine/threonine-protein kinase [Verrucomicrobiota bacterium]
MQIEEVLYEALVGLDDPQQRVAFLDQTCKDSPGLRRRLEKMIDLHDEAEKFFTIAPATDESGMGSPDDDAAEGPGTRIGRYRLIDCLGDGGYGVVYLAEQLEPVRRRVALKIIRVGTDTSGIIARFEMERQALAMMDHPNIARVLDAGATANGRLFFVMQIVDGLRITDFCVSKQLDLQERLRLFIPVCLAIQHAHQKGIIHCDIKPSNVMVTTHDGKAVPKVIDFGIAMATEGVSPDLSDPAAGVARHIGTPAYMSPEQVDGNGPNVDTRSDIFSLGVLLHEILTGKLPRDPGEFENRSSEEIRNLLLERPAPKASERVLADAAAASPQKALARKLRGDLDAILAKAMEPDRRQRYGAASELAADISRYLEHEPVSARRAGGVYRFLRLVRRNRVVFAAGAVVLLALSGGFGTSTWLFIRENQARQEQDKLRQFAETARANEVKLREMAQAAEQVAHAAVLVSHGDIIQANAMLEQVPLDQVPASLESATAYRTVGEWLLQNDRWEEASQRFGAMAQALARADRSDSEAISIHFVTAAAAVVDAGDMPHYEELREMAATRFATTSVPVVADEVVKTCLIRPAPPHLLAKLTPLVKTMEDQLPWDRQDTPEEAMQAWQTLSLCLAKYRQGDLQAAEAWARRCLLHPTINDARTSAALSVLAMTHQLAGQPAAARGVAEVARAKVDAYFREPFQVRIEWTEHGFWFDWVIARILLTEAEHEMSR